MEILTAKQAVEEWDISARRVAILCAEGRIDGALKAGKTWLLPADSKKPQDVNSILILHSYVVLKMYVYDGMI